MLVIMRIKTKAYFFQAIVIEVKCVIFAQID